MQDLLAISLVRSPDLGFVGCVPYQSGRMILSDTLDDKVTGDEDVDDKVTGDEDVRQSQLVATDTHQILNPFLSKVQQVVSSCNQFKALRCGSFTFLFDFNQGILFILFC
jgi:hypothetical protein